LPTPEHGWRVISPNRSPAEEDAWITEISDFRFCLLHRLVKPSCARPTA
jgi:hypothetical protein